VNDIRIVRGAPTDDELAALISVLAGVGGGRAPAPTDTDRWGHPVDKLRYSLTSWQRVTLLERTHLRR
jgi:hypothetical protein